MISPSLISPTGWGCPDFSPSADLTSGLRANISYCLFQVRCQVDRRSVWDVFHVSNLTRLTQIPDLPPDLLLPEPYPSQFKAMVFQLPRPKICSHSRLVSSLSLLLSIQSSGFYLQNTFRMWPFLTSSTITILDYCNSLLIGVLAFPASIFGVTPTSTHSLFSIQEGICYSISQIMSFLCLKFLQAFPARTMPKG